MSNKSAERRDRRSRSNSWREKFIELYLAVAECEPPAGSQLDSVLDEFQQSYNAARHEQEK